MRNKHVDEIVYQNNITKLIHTILGVNPITLIAFTIKEHCKINLVLQNRE